MVLSYGVEDDDAALGLSAGGGALLDDAAAAAGVTFAADIGFGVTSWPWLLWSVCRNARL